MYVHAVDMTAAMVTAEQSTYILTEFLPCSETRTVCAVLLWECRLSVRPSVRLWCWWIV